MDAEHSDDPSAPVTKGELLIEVGTSSSDIATVRAGRIFASILAAAVHLAEDPLQDPYTFAAAIATAGTAAEVAVSVTLGTFAAQKNRGSAFEVQLAGIRNRDLKDIRVRNVWNTITGDTIQHEPFWPGLMEHVERRNQVVHTALIDGRGVTRDEADRSLEAVRGLLDHIKDVLVRNGLS